MLQRLTLILSVWLFSLPPSLTVVQAQQNPFEMQHRLGPGKGMFRQQADSSVARNPFDIPQARHVPVRSLPGREYVVTRALREGLPVPTSFFWVFLGLLLWLTLLVSTNRKFLFSLFRSFQGDTGLRLQQKGYTGILQSPYPQVYLFYLANGGLFLYFLFSRYYNVGFPGEPFRLLGNCLLVLGAYVLLTHLALYWIRNVYPDLAGLRSYDHLVMVFNLVLGVVLFPFNILIAYTEPGTASRILVSCLVIILIILIYRNIRALLMTRDLWMVSIFHFLLYLCAVEMTPLLLVVKFIRLKTGL